MKAMRTHPVMLTGPTGERLFSQSLVVLPDELHESSDSVDGASEGPMTLTRQQYAALIREWRQNPETAPEERNKPTASRLIVMRLRRRFFGKAHSAPAVA